MTAGPRQFAVPHHTGSHRPGPAALRWGVIGATSTVARLAVIPAIEASPKAELVALASLSGHAPSSDAKSYDAYEEVLADPDVEAVYIPLPNHLHREWTERAAAAGKHVLCEKPMAPTAADASAMHDACRTAGVMLAEAYMTPFHPRARAVVDEARGGRLGDVQHMQCTFSFPLRDAGNHRWQAACGGGALLDVGIYCLAPILEIAGRPPLRLFAAARTTPGGVDASFAATLDFGAGLAADVWCSFDAPERQTMVVTGTTGAVSIEQAFTAGPAETSFTIEGADGSSTVLDTGGADPYRGMVDHFQTVVRGGAHLRRPPEDSIALLALMDSLRAAASS